nr:hypothetical protein [Escherichia coli]
MCLFCSQPPKKSNDDWLLTQSALAIASFGLDGVVGVSGGEPLLYGDDFLHFIDFIIENSGDTALHVLTNGRKFSDINFTQGNGKRSKRSKSPLVSLYSSRPLVRDHLVGNDGAFNETVKGLINAGNSGINIELRVIPTLANYTELDDIVEFVGKCVLQHQSDFPYGAGIYRLGTKELVNNDASLSTAVIVRK